MAINLRSFKRVGIIESDREREKVREPEKEREKERKREREREKKEKKFGINIAGELFGF